MDPSHANWLHDGDVGKWEDSAPLSMRLVDNAVDVNQVPLNMDNTLQDIIMVRIVHAYHGS